ncbi:MAG: hypothetical protein NZ516_10455 [Raineya sp.]|nr:hypothetical protein [Raineya sp.]
MVIIAKQDKILSTFIALSIKLPQIKPFVWLKRKLMLLAQKETEWLYLSLRGLQSIMQENPEQIINIKLCKIIDKLENLFENWYHKTIIIQNPQKYEKNFIQSIEKTYRLIQSIQAFIIQYSFSANTDTDFGVAFQDWNDEANQVWNKYL